jgi:hypothetical protein
VGLEVATGGVGEVLNVLWVLRKSTVEFSLVTDLRKLLISADWFCDVAIAVLKDCFRELLSESFCVTISEKFLLRD